MAATSGAIRAGRAFVEIFTDDSKLARGLTAAQNRLNSFAANVGNIGKKLAALGTAALAPVALSTKTFAGFDSEMSRVQALTGATAVQMAALRDQAKQLGATTVFTAADAARAMSFFALAGYDVQKIMAAMGPTLNLAAAGQMDVAQAADIAAKIMAGSGIEAKNLGYAIDVLVKAMTTANTDLPMLGDAMKYVGPVAKTAGVAFEETVAAIQLLSDSGIQADMAGTTLRGALLALTDPSKEARAELEALGVKVLDDAGKIRKLADVVDDFNHGLAGKGGGERLGIIGRVFDARQAAGFAELLNKGGDLLRQRTGALGTALGTGAKIAATQLDNLKGDAVILTSALEGLKIQAGEAVAPALRGLAQDATGLTNALTQLAKSHPELIVNFTKGAAVAVALGGALFATSKILGLLSMGIGLLKLPLQVGTLAMSAFTVAGGLATSAMAALNAVLALGPVGLAALGVGLASAALNWDAFNRGSADAGKHLSDVFGKIRNDVALAIQGVTSALKSGDLQQAMEVVGAAMELVWQRTLAAMLVEWDRFKDNLLDAAKEAPGRFANSFMATTPGGKLRKHKDDIEAARQAGLSNEEIFRRQVAGEPIVLNAAPPGSSRIADLEAKLRAATSRAVNGPLRPFSAALDWMKSGLGRAAGAMPAPTVPGGPRTNWDAWRPWIAADHEPIQRPEFDAAPLATMADFFSGVGKDWSRGGAASATVPWAAWTNFMGQQSAAGRAVGTIGGLFGAAGSGLDSITSALGGSLGKIAGRVATAVQETSTQITTGGTFSGLYAAQQLGVGNVQKEIAKNTGQAVQQLQKVNQGIKKIKLPRII